MTIKKIILHKPLPLPRDSAATSITIGDGNDYEAELKGSGVVLSVPDFGGGRATYFLHLSTCYLIIDPEPKVAEPVAKAPTKK